MTREQQFIIFEYQEKTDNYCISAIYFYISYLLPAHDHSAASTPFRNTDSNKFNEQIWFVVELVELIGFFPLLLFNYPAHFFFLFFLLFLCVFFWWQRKAETMQVAKKSWQSRLVRSIEHLLALYFSIIQSSFVNLIFQKLEM